MQKLRQKSFITFVPALAEKNVYKMFRHFPKLALGGVGYPKLGLVSLN